MEIGEAIGFQNYLSLKLSTNNLSYECTMNSEILEIEANRYQEILLQSSKGID